MGLLYNSVVDIPACHFCFCPLAVGKEKNPALVGPTHSYGNLEVILTSPFLPVTVGFLKKKKKKRFRRLNNSNKRPYLCNINDADIISQMEEPENPNLESACENDTTIVLFLYLT